LQAAIGSRISSVWREFLAWERLTPQALSQTIDERLVQLLETSNRHSAYYRELNLQRRTEESAFTWLSRFPILSRENVRAHFHALLSDDLRDQVKSLDSVSTRRYDWLIVKTGGSTGIPTTVVHDARTRDWGRATRLYAARQCGFPLGTAYFRLWGSEQDLLRQRSSLQQRLLRSLLSEVPLNAFKAKEADLRQHLKTMASHPQIRHLMTYVDAAVGLAEFAQERQIALPKLKSVMACAGTVTPEFRRILEQGFQAKVFDKYGSRECCDMACECSHHAGLHVFSPNAYLEIVDEGGHWCPPGSPGRILVTMLNNHSFPLIRYEIGDLGIWAAPGPCPCGSPFPRLQSLEGRQDDMLITEDGTLQSPAFVRHFVGVSLNRQTIREWQMEQTDKHQFIFRYVPLRQEGLEQNLQQLKQSFELVFGPASVIELQRVCELAPAATGKVRWIVNSYRRRSNAVPAPLRK
jgi:phenylacetate-CoA ligase